MSGNRPRPSLINLFDPLANSATTELPSTPSRNAQDADKENHNSSPNTLAMTMFFNQIAKQASHPQPTPLKRRLVDIGDMTLEDAARPEALLDEGLEDDFNARFDQVDDDEENATLTFRDMVKAATPIRTLKTVVESPNESFPMPRMPLADIAVEQTTPVLDSTPNMESTSGMELSPPEKASEKLNLEETVQPEEQAPSGASAPELVQELPISPEDIPLPPSPIMTTQEFSPADSIAEVVGQADQVELPPPESSSPTAIATTNDGSATMTADNAHTESNASLEIPSFDVSNILTPSGTMSGSSGPLLADISIPIVLSNSSPPAPTSSLPERESDKESSPIARLRPNPPNTSSNDISRFSVDLYASFQMQMQSDDLSFDLLGDKMSFFNSRAGLESFLSAVEDDPNFDLEAERIKMERALKKCSAEKHEKAEKASTSDDISSVSSSPAPVTPVDVLGVPPTPGYDHDTPEKTGLDLKTVRKRLSIPIAISSPRPTNVSSHLTGRSSLSRSSSLSLSLANSGAPIAISLQSPTTSSGSGSASSALPEKRRGSLQLVTPKYTRDNTLPSQPPPLPPLKIAKRPRPGHGRNDSISEQKLGSAPPLKLAELSSIAPLKTKKTTKDQEAPQVAEPESRLSRQSTKRRSLVLPRPPVPATQVNGQGPRRVLISEGPRLGSTDPKSTTVPSTLASGPRRVPAPSTSTISTTQTRSAAAMQSGLKGPTQPGTTASTTTSSLPKLVSRPSLTSRLPAPKSLKSGGLPIFRRPT